jgi:hypothetical protein
VRGGEPSRARPYEVPLLGGWNQIGVPFNRSFTINSIRVLQGTTSMPLSTAISSGAIGAGIWRWKIDGGYDRVDFGTSTDQTLQPFEGIYIFSRFPRGVTLVFDPVATTAYIGRAAISKDNWRVPIYSTAISGNTIVGRDTDGAFGVTSAPNGILTQRPAARPPAGPRSITLAFTSSGDTATDSTKAGASSGWAESLVKPDVPMIWNGLIDGANANQTVVINWGRIDTLPVSINATFIDITTGGRIDMAKVLTYRYVSNGTLRRFRIEATARPVGIQSFTAGVLTGSRSVQATAKFGLAGYALVDIETPSGTLVANLGERTVQPGTSSWVWDGKDTAGRVMPGGTYVARLYFRDDRNVASEKTVSFVLPQ